MTFKNKSSEADYAAGLADHRAQRLDEDVVEYVREEVGFRDAPRVSSKCVSYRIISTQFFFMLISWK